MYPPLTVYDNVAFNLRAKGVDKAEIDRRVREIAPLMQIDDLLDKMPVKLSGGQKQRVNIARRHHPRARAAADGRASVPPGRARPARPCVPRSSA